jgi:crossover junction endodeoxyribonuclease RusA
MIRLELPFPPSVWDMYEGWGKRRHLSDSYAKWRQDAGWFIRGVREPLSGPVSVHIALKRPRANADLDNRAKCVIDALQHYQVFKNDKQVERLTMQWHPGPAECVVIVQPAEEGMAQ